MKKSMDDSGKKAVKMRHHDHQGGEVGGRKRGDFADGSPHKKRARYEKGKEAIIAGTRLASEEGEEDEVAHEHQSLVPTRHPRRSLEKIANSVGVRIWQVEVTKGLLEEQNSIPFIARYRKEKTGGLDENQLRHIQVGLERELRLEKRRESVIKALQKQGVFEGRLAQRLRDAEDINQVEDLYLHFKPARTTRAKAAREKGLEAVAKALLRGDESRSPWTLLKEVMREKGIAGSPDDAMQGAKDILAEMASESFEGRVEARRAAWKGRITSQAARKGKQRKKGTGASTASATDPATYQAYTSFTRRLEDLAAHVCLTLNRGEALGFLTVKVEWEEGPVIRKCLETVCTHVRFEDLSPGYRKLVEEAVKDGVSRLIKPSIDREIRSELTDRAVKEAIKIFSLNLEKLLLSPPLVGSVLGCDPGFSHGVKLAAVARSGEVLDTAVIYPFERRAQEAKATLVSLINKHSISVLAIGNGVGSSKTEAFVAQVLKERFGSRDGEEAPVGWTVVNERGASVYSASELAAEELPNLDVTLRGAVSIARRLQDPLSEYVKVDPQSLGVGLYQHDVKPALLTEELDYVVRMCVSRVGVDLNVASPCLLRYVSGLNKATADRIVASRAKHPFRSREDLRQVRGIGEKSFEQAAGFLRLRDPTNALDSTGVHPESYEVAARLIDLVEGSKKGRGGVVDTRRLESSRRPLAALLAGKGKMTVEACAADLGVTPATVREIATFLCDKGRDVRGEFSRQTLWTGLNSVNDLRPGRELLGVVSNVVSYGAFVDIKMGRDALLHKHQIPALSTNKSGATVEDIMSIGLHVGEKIRVKINNVDPVSGKVGVALLEIVGG